MCGICGVIGMKSTDRSAAILRRMLDSIVHRGPDEEGTWVAPGLAAGTRRLSIIDLAGGSQPIWNEAETLAIFFNGEIYNFRELRDELATAGHRFRTRSDTEVVLHAYEEWGEAGFRRLHGMFGVAIAEMPQGKSGPVVRVILARDRFGIKPLYYAAIDGVVFFASEVHALLASGEVPAQLSADAIPSYLLFGSVAEPCTIVDRVFSLPPGHTASIPAGGPPCDVETKAYWRASFEDKRLPHDSGPASQRVRALLEDAVRSHLIADVPVGVFLSSGLDSTAIAALAARAQKDIHTFTVAFPDLEFSEAEVARNTAARLGTQHSELQISGDEMVARLDEAVAAFDQPSMDGMNTFFVSWAARQAGLKVALSGLGSDELFGGYPTFRSTASVARLEAIARAVPGPLRSAMAWTARSISPKRAATPAFEKALTAWLAPGSLPHPYYYTRALFTPETAAAQSANREAWTRAPWWNTLGASTREARAMDGFTAVSWLELRSYMLNTLLRDTDGMSMRHSLEVRVPFLDTPLVEGVLSLPESEKHIGDTPKSLLIAAMGDLLPAGIVGQRKRTFTFPWEKWLRGSLGARVSAGLADWSPALRPVLSQKFALSVWENFQRGGTTWSRPWSLYVLNEWAKRHLRSAEAGPAAASTAAEVFNNTL